jgi:hypothetical protein
LGTGKSYKYNGIIVIGGISKQVVENQVLASLRRLPGRKNILAHSSTG